MFVLDLRFGFFNCEIILFFLFKYRKIKENSLNFEYIKL